MSKIKIDPEDLTLDEIEEVETVLGSSIDLAFANGSPKGKALRAILLVITKRTDPEATLESVGKLKLSDLDLSTEDDSGN